MFINNITQLLKYLLLVITLFALTVTISVSQSANKESKMKQSILGKTVLITGSTDGLGRETALRLGALGAKVLVHGRNEERGTEVVNAIKNNGGKAKFYEADFSSLQNVRDLAQAIVRENKQLHVLINNAGIGSGFAGGKRQVSDDGYEMVFQVNYLAHYLLTDLLLPIIKASAPARIINVASRAQRTIDFDNVMLKTNFSGRAAYGQSKLAQILHTFHLAEKLDSVGVSFNVLHPASMMDTTMVSQLDRPARTTVDEGATALVNLVLSLELEERTGLYFNGLNESTANSQAYDRQSREKLEQLSRELVNLP